MRMDDGITQPGQKLPVVVDDVAIVQSDHVAVSSREKISVRKPTGAALAVIPRGQPSLAKHRKQVLDTRTVHPQNRYRCVEVFEEASRPEVRFSGRAPKNDTITLGILHLPECRN